MKRRRPMDELALGDWTDDDYEVIARTARREAKRALRGGGRLAVRQAAEKSYLAAVEMARSVLSRAGEDQPQRSSTAIGGALNVLTGKRYGPAAKAVTGAMTRALAHHAGCFYDRKCDAEAVFETADDLLRAARTVKRIKISN